MDYSKFSHEDFELNCWVNKALKSEQNPNTLVMKLQLLMQELNVSLEETTSQLLSDIPHVLSEINALTNEAKLLRNQMNLVKADINKVEVETVESMSTVVKLDKIKERMLTTESKLKQADNWSLLNEHIDQLFEEQDISAISLKLEEMREALAALINLPDYEVRSDRLNNLSNKLEAMISPKLIAAINSHKSEEARRYNDMFCDMGRTEELYNYYYRTHRTSVNKMYSALRGTDSLDTWLPHFYSSMLELYHEEVRWCTGVFDDHATVVLTLLTQCLSTLDHDISSFMSDNTPTSLDAIVSLIHISNRFIASLSKELSTDVHSEVIESLGRAIITPYTNHILSFGDKVKSALLRDINSIPIRLKKTSTDSLAELQTSTRALINTAARYIPLCLECTNGQAITQVIAALQFYFDLFCEKLSALIKDFRIAFGIEQGSHSSLQEDHWVGFQSCFKFLQIIGECYVELEAFQTEMIQHIKDHSPKDVFLLSNINIWYEANLTRYNANVELLSEIKSCTKTTIFDKTFEVMLKPISSCNKLCVDFVLSHIKSNIHGIHLIQDWYKEEGAVFTPSPLTYITTLGDYLLLLPQQLEPFFAEENVSLDTALHLVNFSQYPGMTDAVEGDAFAWLTCVCQSTMYTVVEMILRIPRLSKVGCKQLAADVSYISNVMAALEVPLSRDVVDISRLLSLPIDRVISDETTNIPKYLCNKISAMRRAAV